MTSCFESELFPVPWEEHTLASVSEAKLGRPAATPGCGEGASPGGRTPASRRQPQGPGGMISQAWVEQAADKVQAPLLTDIISFDGQRLRLFFQLGLLEDSGRTTDLGLIGLTNIKGVKGC